MPQSIEQALESYLAYLIRAKGHDQLTVAHYRDYLTRFFRTERVETPADISLKRIELFRQSMTRSGLKASTQNYHLIALRGFIRWLPKAERRLDHRSITLMRTTVAKTRPFPRRSIVTLLEHTPPSSTLLAARDRAIIETLWSTDLRLNELPLLLTERLDQKKGQLKIPGKRERILKLGHHALFYIKDYLGRRMDRSPYLFIRHDRANAREHMPRPISTRSIQRLIIRSSNRKDSTNSIRVRDIENARTTSY